MNKTSASFRFAGVILLAAVCICLAYGRPLEISGYGAVFLWLLPPIGSIWMIQQHASGHRLKQGILLFCLILYLLASGLHTLQNSARSIVSDAQFDRYYAVTYEVNPGAMSGFSYEQRKYYLLLDADILTIRYLLQCESHGYLG